MDDQRPLDDELQSFADALAELKLLPSTIDRAEVLCQLQAADHASEVLIMKIRLRGWKLATMLSTVASLILACVLTMERMHPPMVPANSTNVVNPEMSIVNNRLDSRPARGDLAADQRERDIDVSYISLRNHALSAGIDSLRMPEFAGASSQRGSSIKLDDNRYGG